jgi:hypothetical protein
LQEASARLDLDAACGQLLLPTVCIAEVRIFEIRPLGLYLQFIIKSYYYYLFFFCFFFSFNNSQFYVNKHNQRQQLIQ